MLEREETIADALQREVLEETGIKIALPATSPGLQEHDGLIVSMVFRCEAIDGAPTTGAETRALCWATRDEVTELADEAYASASGRTRHTSPPAIRAHDGVRLI
ncbi:hypothetical protein GCM10017744_101130 [Streptomyces antimycoticus]